MSSNGCQFSGPFTMTLSVSMSHNQSSHAGTLSLGFCLNHCTISISSAAMYGHTVIRNVVWVGSYWSGGTPTSLPCGFFLFFELQLVGSWRDPASVQISRSDLLVPSLIESSLHGFSHGSMVLSKEMFQSFCRGVIRFVVSFHCQYCNLQFPSSHRPRPERPYIPSG